MLTIYKYPIQVTDLFTIAMPEDAKILSVQSQHGSPQLWALVNTSRQSVSRHFRLIGTGHPINDSAAVLDYIGTFQIEAGSLVFHLFEVDAFA